MEDVFGSVWEVWEGRGVCRSDVCVRGVRVRDVSMVFGDWTDCDATLHTVSCE